MARPEPNISRLRNLGDKSQEWLNDIGITDRASLERVGSVETYRILKERGYRVSMLLVYALEAALMDIDWRELPLQLKSELKAAVKSL